MSDFEEYFYKNIALQVRKYRIKNKLSQEQLSEMLSKNLKYIGHIERCKRKISNNAIIELLNLLHIQPSEFYAFEESYSWNKD